MSRSGYSDDCEGWSLIRWRGAVTSAIRGKRGQAFLREALAALDALPEPALIPNNLAADGAFCTLGAVGRARGTDLSGVDIEDHESVANLFGVPHALACEVMFENDELGGWDETPRARWERMRRWIVANLNDDQPSDRPPAAKPWRPAMTADTEDLAKRLEDERAAGDFAGLIDALRNEAGPHGVTALTDLAADAIEGLVKALQWATHARSTLNPETDHG